MRSMKTRLKPVIDPGLQYQLVTEGMRGTIVIGDCANCWCSVYLITQPNHKSTDDGSSNWLNSIQFKFKSFKNKHCTFTHIKLLKKHSIKITSPEKVMKINFLQLLNSF